MQRQEEKRDRKTKEQEMRKAAAKMLTFKGEREEKRALRGLTVHIPSLKTTFSEEPHGSSVLSGLFNPVACDLVPA